jgi:hypothetical protein
LADDSSKAWSAMAATAAAPIAVPRISGQNMNAAAGQGVGDGQVAAESRARSPGNCRMLADIDSHPPSGGAPSLRVSVDALRSISESPLKAVLPRAIASLQTHPISRNDRPIRGPTCSSLASAAGEPLRSDNCT